MCAHNAEHFINISIAFLFLTVMKLAAFRPEDLQDISHMQITKEDIKIIQRAIGKIAHFDTKKAHIITLFLKEKNLWKDE